MRVNHLGVIDIKSKGEAISILDMYARIFSLSNKYSSTHIICIFSGLGECNLAPFCYPNKLNVVPHK